MMENGYDTKEHVFSSMDTLNSIKSDRKKEDENVRQDSKKCDSTLREKHLAGFFKNSFKTLSIPKKAVSEKDKNEPSRFLGEGVTFKAKLIGILEVEEARGDRMCQEALFELKMAVRAAGEHKQRINIVIAIDGIRLRDEKSGDCLHHHPVHKISFIAQDVADSRAFGYVFGSPDTSHRFFGIKTDKAASQVVMAMRDLFQAVYELKKREVEMAKQNIEQHQLKYGSSFFLDSVSATSSKTSIDQMSRLKQVPREDMNKNAKNKTQTTSVIADLMDLELELNSLQQGLSQMERLTPSDPFGPSPSLPKEDPFGDSFTPPPCITTPPPAKLPPPPASGERRKVGGSTSSAASQPELHWFDKETQDLFSSEKNLNAAKEGKEDESKSMSSSRDLYDIFVELDPLGTGRSKPYTDKKDFFQELKNPPKKQLKDLKGREIDGMSHGTAASKSLYSEESAERTYEEHLRKYRPIDSDQRITLAEELAKRDETNSDPFETSFANFASFENVTRRSPASAFSAIPRRSPQSHFRQQSPPIHLDNHTSYNLGASTVRSSSNSSKSVYKSITSGDDVDSPSSQTYESYASRRSPQWNRLQEDTSKQKIVIDLRKVLSNVDDTDKENDSPVTEEAMILKNRDTMSPGCGGNASSDSFESIPEPPPRPITSPVISQPPPLPPKKLQLPVTLKPPPPRPASDRTSHYDYIENYESVGSSRQTLRNGDVQIPPLPAPARKPKYSHLDSDHRDFIRHRPQKQHSLSSVASAESDYYLTPISKSRLDQQRGSAKSSKPSLNITLSQLTSSGFEDLASILRIPASALSKMTLKELTECLSGLTEAECQKLERDMNNRNRDSAEDMRPSYHSLKESFDDDVSTPASSFRANFDGKFPVKNNSINSGPASAPPQVDKYAVFRELIDQEQMSSSFNTASPELPDDNEEELSTKAENDGVSDKEKERTAKDKELSDRYAVLRTIETKGKGEEGDHLESESDAKADESKFPNKTHSVGDGSGPLRIDNSQVAKQLTESDIALENDRKTDVDKLSTKEGTAEIEKQSISDSDAQTLAENKNSNKEVEERRAKESGVNDEVGKNWAKFDSEHDTKEERNSKIDSPWQEQSKETSRKSRPIKYKKQTNPRKRWNKYDDEDDEEEDFEEDEDDEDIEALDGENELEDDENDDEYGDDSEENWECSKKSLASSWDESSWRENGWSDRDSLYDEEDVSPASRFRDQQYRTQKREYPRKFKSHSKKSGGQPLWDEDASEWAGQHTRRRDVDPPPYREYVESGDRGGYDPRKIRTPERKPRSNPKEENELALLKMMLGKKRLKALEEQLFKHYHDQLSEKSSSQNTSKKYSSKMKGSASSLLLDRQYDELKGKTSRRVGGGSSSSSKKYHTQTRPKSAEKGRKPLLLRPEDTEELYVKGRYRRPYSQDELSISEDEQWTSRTSPSGTGFKKLPPAVPNVRSRQHSQNSPFEDNFAPSGRTYSEFGSDGGVAGDDSKLANTSTTTITTIASSMSNASLLRGRNQPLPQSRYSTSANKTQIGNSAYASCDNLKYGRSSRDSSQRQSPFEDDFNAPSETPRIDVTGGEECEDRRRPDDDVFFSNGIVSSASAGASVAIEPSTVNRKARSARANTRGPGEGVHRTSSETSHASNSSKYYENVELRKKKSPSDVYGGTMKERFKREVTAEMTTASPKKGKRGGACGADTRRHDPFNDNVARGFESRTVPRSGQKVRGKSRNATYVDSGSDSTEPGADTAAFAFSDQHSRK